MHTSENNYKSPCRQVLHNIIFIYYYIQQTGLKADVVHSTYVLQSLIGISDSRFSIDVGI